MTSPAHWRRTPRTSSTTWSAIRWGRCVIGERYAHLFNNVKGEDFAVKHRLYGENFVVDDKIWTARVEGEFLGLPAHGRRIHVRVLHVFEFRDGLISRENVWLDDGSVIAQLTGSGTLASTPAGETVA